MRKLIGVALVLGIVSVLMLTAAASAAEVQGKIKSFDAAAATVTLEDGTKLLIPSALQLTRDNLKPGASVKASFESQGGDNVVTSIVVIDAR